jgi:hypothetical protein
MTTKQKAPETGGHTGATPGSATAVPDRRAVHELAMGDIIRVDGLEDNQVVRKVKRIRKGLDAGLVHVTLEAPDGDRERIALAPEDDVTFVGPALAAAKGTRGTKVRSKGQTNKARGRPAAVAVATAAPQTSERPASTTLTPNRSPQGAAGAKPMSCLDAAARLVTHQSGVRAGQGLPGGPQRAGIPLPFPARGLRPTHPL